MVKFRFRQAISTIFLTTFVSFLIGGFAVWNSFVTEQNNIDQTLHNVISQSLANPKDALNEAIASADIRNADVTIAFIAPPSAVTILRESSQINSISININALTKSLLRPVQLDGQDGIRVIAMPLTEGEYLLVAASTTNLEASLHTNEIRLFLFILLSNIGAGFITLLLFRRQRIRSSQEQLRRMQEFLGDAAHELRTPLTVIKGYSELLAQKKMPTPADETRAFDRLQNEISRMNFLISDLLLLAEMGEMTVLEKESFDLVEVLQNHINDFMTISEEHPVIFEGEVSLDFYGSQIHMQRLIQNALTNIRLHTPSTAPVRVSLLHKSKEIQLLIEDGGPGLADSAYGEAVRSLQRFDRSRSRVTGGSGLGMSIISGVVSMHDGKLSLQKSELGGLAIDIRLPITTKDR